MMYVPAYKHTSGSDVNISKLPNSVTGTKLVDGKATTWTVLDQERHRQAARRRHSPSVSIIKEGGYYADTFGDDPSPEGDLDFLIKHKLAGKRLGGFVVEGLVPYGNITSELRGSMLRTASFMGLPVVKVGRGYPEGFADPDPWMISGSNLTSTKARLLLMACLMKFGAPPGRRSEEPDPDGDRRTQGRAGEVPGRVPHPLTEASMLRLHGIIGTAQDAAYAGLIHELEHSGGIELLFVPPSDAGRKRFRLVTDRGTDCAVSLDRDEDLVDGAVLFIDPERAIIARFGEQEIWRAEADRPGRLAETRLERRQPPLARPLRGRRAPHPARRPAPHLPRPHPAAARERRGRRAGRCLTPPPP